MLVNTSSWARLSSDSVVASRDKSVPQCSRRLQLQVTGRRRGAMQRDREGIALATAQRSFGWRTADAAMLHGVSHSGTEAPRHLCVIRFLLRMWPRWVGNWSRLALCAIGMLSFTTESSVLYHTLVIQRPSQVRRTRRMPFS